MLLVVTLEPFEMDVNEERDSLHCGVFQVLLHVFQGTSLDCNKAYFW